MPSDLPIVPRRWRFKIDKTLPVYWNDGCPVKTHLFNAIAVLAPGFERLAIASVLPYQKAIHDPILGAQLQGFIHQESAHGSEFIRFNHILRGQGYDTKALERAGLRQFKRLANLFSSRMHLSLTLAAEHMTAIISNLLLSDPEWLSRAESRCAGLWRWHAVEEIEHKAVAYDVYKAIGGGYFTRLMGMLLMLGMVNYLLARNFFYFVHHDKKCHVFYFWWTLFQVLWGKKGFLRRLIVPLFHYFSPFFHPWKNDNRALIKQWEHNIFNP